MRRQKHTTEGGRDCELDKRMLYEALSKSSQVLEVREKAVVTMRQSGGGCESCLFMWGAYRTC